MNCKQCRQEASTGFTRQIEILSLEGMVDRGSSLPMFNMLILQLLITTKATTFAIACMIEKNEGRNVHDILTTPEVLVRSHQQEKFIFIVIQS